MYALGVMVAIALCLAWTITQPPSTVVQSTARPAASRPTVAPMPPLPKMTRPTVMPATEVKEAVVSGPPTTREPSFSGFGGFGSIDGLGGGSGGSWLSHAQPLEPL